jgi:Leucine-rich repeat (LRR) protein
MNIFPASLQELDLRHCNLSDSMIPHDFRGLFLLQTLKLCGNNFTSLPASIGNLPKLTKLLLNNCKRLEYIPELQSSLETFHANDCPRLQFINMKFWRGGELKLNGCRNLKCLQGFFNLEPLGVDVVEKILGTCGLVTEKPFPAVEVHIINNLTRTAIISPLQVSYLSL